MYTLVIDGGSKGNGSTNAGYGSVALYVNGDRTQMTVDGKKTFQLEVVWPDSTNNEAELKTALVAMAYASHVQIRAAELAEKAGKPVPVIDWEFQTDSELVARLAKGMPKKSKSPHLTPLYEQVIAWLRDNPNSMIKRVPRNEIVKVLGH
jgi:ribonuclease HI